MILTLDQFLERNTDPLRINLAIVDLDGVVIDNSHRLSFITEVVDGKSVDRKEPDWAAFHGQKHLDPPGAFAETASYWVRHRVYDVMFLTARAELDDNTRQEVTDKVIEVLNLKPEHANLATLVMRTKKQKMRAVEFKMHIIAELLARGIKPAMAIDDYHDMCVAYQKAGIPTLRFYNHLNETTY